MSEIPPTSTPRGPQAGSDGAGRQGPAQLFRPGQIVEGRITASPEGPRLRVGEITLPLRGDIRPTEGSRLLLEVIRVRPALDMRILEQSGRSTGNQAAGDRFTLARETLAREGLARQLDSRSLLQSLRLITQPPGGETNRLPPALRQALTPLMTAMSSVREISSADGVRRALQDSGLFSENRLMLGPRVAAAGSTAAGIGQEALARDWKVALGRSLLNLRSAVREGRLPAPIHTANPSPSSRPGAVPPPPGSGWNSSPPGSSPLLQGASTASTPASGQQGQLLRELPDALRIVIRQIEGALGRNELQQAASQTGDGEGGRTQLWFEVPVQRQEAMDLWQFYLQREEQAAKRRGEESWTVTLAVHLPELGPFYAELRLRGARLSAHLYAESGDTVERLRRNLGYFRERLQTQLLKLDQVGVRAGQPPPGMTALPMKTWRSEA